MKRFLRPLGTFASVMAVYWLLLPVYRMGESPLFALGLLSAIILAGVAMMAIMGSADTAPEATGVPHRYSGHEGRRRHTYLVFGLVLAAAGLIVVLVGHASVTVAVSATAVAVLAANGVRTTPPK